MLRSKRFAIIALGICGLLVQRWPLAFAAEAARPEQIEFFETKVRPLLVEQCLSCHGDKKQEAGLRLDIRAAMLKGGDSGAAIVPGDPEKSLLIKAVQHAGDLEMPPEKRKMRDSDINMLAAWIRQGAPWPEAPATASKAPSQAEAAKNHWAFQPIQLPPVPLVKNTAWGASPLDLFVLSKLEAAKLAPAPPADRHALLRRVTFDLIGLPPTPEEVAAFVADTSPDAFAHVVDRLLASPHYGERWGRYWLDVARYADTKGYVFMEQRNYPFAFTYRDWVIGSLNADLPYDQFVVQQLAGDRLPRSDDRTLAALGYLTLGRRFLNNKNDIIDDRIDVMCRGLLGLTVGCARCHDHKFDPIPTQDYYSLYGVFDSSVEKQLQLEPPSPEFLAGKKAIQDKLDGMLKRVNDDLIKDAREKLADYLLAGQAARKQKPEQFNNPPVDGQPHPKIVLRWRKLLDGTAKQFHPILAPWHALADLPEADFAAKSGEALHKLFDQPAAKGRINPRVAEAFAGDPPQSLKEAAQRYAKVLAAVDQQWHTVLAEAAAKQQPVPTVLANAADESLRKLLYADDGPGNVPLAETEKFLNKKQQNDYRKLRSDLETYEGTIAAPLQTLTLNDASNPVTPHVFLRGNPGKPGPEVKRHFLSILEGDKPEPFKDGSGRLEMARKIASKDNPLTARVIVNRVWLHHFGVGLVRTPSDFGIRTAAPQQRDLLDYLAAQFIADGWSLKKLHRAIVLSNTYQQSTDHPREVACSQIDPENNLLWKMNRQRLDFEALRDSLLAVGGNLDGAIGGRSIELEKLPIIPRRTVYGFIDRQNLPGLLRTFDFAVPDAHSPQRFVTTIPQQALYLLNGPLAIEEAKLLAKRNEAEAGADHARRVNRLYATLFGRNPTAEEMSLANNFLASAAKESAADKLTPWERYVQVLLMSNEFAFTD